jgi:hypothetical protein
MKVLGTFVEHKDGMMVTEFQSAYREIHRQEMPICSELNSWEFIARSMEKSHGYGLIPDLITLKGRYPYLIPISEPQLPYNLCAMFPKGEQLSFSAHTFLNSLKEFIVNRK